jgi:hypothetical protein
MAMIISKSITYVNVLLKSEKRFPLEGRAKSCPDRAGKYGLLGHVYINSVFRLRANIGYVNQEA